MREVFEAGIKLEKIFLTDGDKEGDERTALRLEAVVRTSSRIRCTLEAAERTMACVLIVSAVTSL
jgi:hypothetical protein